MKKNLLLIILPIIMSIGLTIQSTAQGEFFGKWVLPTVIEGNNSSHETLLLSFMSDEIQYTYITAIPPEPSQNSCEIAAGGYYPNYDLEFHVLGETFYFQESSCPWNFVCSQTINTFHAEYQIINRPGYSDRYYSFYTGRDLDDVLRDKFTYNEIWFDNDIPQFSCHNYLFGGMAQGNSVAFAITQEEDLERHLYSTTITNGSDPAGLWRWTITQNGVGNMTDIITTNNSSIVAEDFSSYNLELKTENNGDIVIAWITTNENSYDSVFVVINGTESIYDLNLGRIGGIEFSSLFDDRLYVSCLDTGIVAINYNTGAIVKYLYTTTDNDFGRTFLQTAPDGHIYAVSNDGTKLGQISMQDETFTPAYFDIPGFGNIVSTHRIFDGSKYYILPENDREYCPLTATVELQHVCPGQCTGEAWIDEDSIICGHGPYTYTWYNNDNQVIGNSNHIYDLCEGSYRVEMQDFYDLIFEEEFVITVDTDYYDHDWYIVDENEDWTDFELSFLGGIRIKAGYKLELINSHLKFLKPGKIIIEQGARLIVDHSTLTYYPECDVKWQGIEVLGDGTQHQYTINGICYQGYLELKNNSEVSYSENAVSLYKTTIDSINIKRIINWDSCGGIVRSTNTNFLNNTRAVHFIPYSNFNPYQVDMQMDNLSHFIKDTFDINLNNIGDSIFYKHADMHGVKGINFHGCTFTNSDTNFVSQWNLGIAAYGAGFEVKAVCTEPMVPCPSQYTIPSSFNGFYWGIGAYSSLEYVYPFQIWDANFTNNFTGIYVSGVNFGVMINNDFEIGLITPGGGLCDDEAFGIDMFDATGFAIEGNYFEKMPIAPKANYVGIRIKNTNSGYDEVYRNTFDGLSFANLAEGKNWKGEDIWTGLAYYCNEDTANWADFWVKRDDNNIGGIQARQGDDDHAAGNTFSSNSTWDFYNGGQFEIGYYYCSTCPDEIPDDGKLYHVTDEARNVQNLCPDHYGGSGVKIELTSAERLQKETEYSDNLYDYNSIKSQYDAFIDGGNTDVELTDVQTAQPDEMWELRAQLLGHSPHLSLEVLMEASDQTDVFPDDVLFDILSANPDELKKDTLISYLENKEDPLPDYMISILQQVANGTTYKTVLQNQMAYYNRNKSKAAYDIVRSIMADTTINITDLRNWLDNIGGIRADEQIIATYMQENNYADALSLANMLPALYEFSGNDSTEHIYFMDLLNLQINIKQQGRNIFQLDSTEMATLLTIADTSLSTAGAKARGILEYAYKYNYCNCLDLSDTLAYKNQNNNWSNFDKLSSVEITAQPNPASTWAAFNYTLPGKDSKGTIRITDISGKLIQTINIRGKQGQYVWDTRFVKSGVYLYTIQAEGLRKTGKIVISK